MTETSKPFTGVSLFSGGGLAEIGLSDCVQMVGAVEYDPAIAAHYASVWGDHMINADVSEVDYRQFAGIDWGHASPSCQRASIANSQGGETEQDTRSGKAVERFIEEARPQVFTLENVRGYASFAAFQGICDTLTRCGYTWDTQILNSADYGVPQTRIRLFIRAWLSPFPLPRMEPTHAERGKIASAAAYMGLFDEAPLLPWNGWYAAIEDLIPTLPESKFAPWQLARLPKELSETAMIWQMDQPCRSASIRDKDQPVPTVEAGMMRRPSSIPVAFIVDGQETVPGKNGERLVSGSDADEPFLTVSASQAKGMPRAFLCGVQGEDGDLYRPSERPAQTVTSNHAAAKQRAYLVEGDSAGDRCPTRSVGQEPAFTMKAAEGGRVHRAYLPWLSTGRVVSMTTRCSARFQGVPDSYPLPENKKLASTLTGNGVPPILMRAVALPLLRGSIK